jgi:putative Holliday junction resolvase
MEPAQAPPNGTVIAFDFGSKRIGVAVGHTDVQQASPLQVVRNIHGRPEWDVIEKLVNEWQPVAFVVGLPLTEDNTAQPQLELSAAFAKKLHRKFELPVYRSDERFSSIEASSLLAENRRRGKRRKTNHGDTDKIAAALILDHWFTQL